MKKITKKFVAVILIVLLLFCVLGCGAAESEPVKDETEQKQEDEVSDTPDVSPANPEEPEETEEAGQGDASNYDEILARFYEIISNPDEDYDDAPGEMGVLEVARGEGDNALDAIGYIITDISGDGVPELMIGGMSEYKSGVNAVYTLVDRKPQLVLEGWYRNLYSYDGDGIFYNYCSNGAAESCMGTFAITRDGTSLECQSFYFTHADEDSGELQVYYNTIGSWDTEKSEVADMSVEDFWRLELPSNALSFTPFSSFGSKEAKPE